MTTRPQRPPRRVFTYANVVATAALLTAVTGAGVAADAAAPKYVITKIGQIKPGVVKKLTAATGGTGTTGATGPQGPAGPQGVPGQRGADATGPVPSGKTISGAYYVVDTPESVYTIPLPMPLATKLASERANFAADSSTATTDDDPTCTGSYANPTAPPGTLCVYAEAQNFTSATVETFNELNLRDRGVYLNYSGSSSSFFGSWAYTAP